MLVHPDKNPGDEAREAFEALNEAHRQLRDRGGLVSICTPAENTILAPQMSCCDGSGKTAFSPLGYRGLVQKTQGSGLMYSIKGCRQQPRRRSQLSYLSLQRGERS